MGVGLIPSNDTTWFFAKDQFEVAVSRSVKQQKLTTVVGPMLTGADNQALDLVRMGVPEAQHKSQ